MHKEESFNILKSLNIFFFVGLCMLNICLYDIQLLTPLTIWRIFFWNLKILLLLLIPHPIIEYHTSDKTENLNNVVIT
jgi:hypothetical protein